MVEALLDKIYMHEMYTSVNFDELIQLFNLPTVKLHSIITPERASCYHLSQLPPVVVNLFLIFITMDQLFLNLLVKLSVYIHVSE